MLLLAPAENAPVLAPVPSATAGATTRCWPELLSDEPFLAVSSGEDDKPKDELEVQVVIVPWWENLIAARSQSKVVGSLLQQTRSRLRGVYGVHARRTVAVPAGSPLSPRELRLIPSA